MSEKNCPHFQMIFSIWCKTYMEANKDIYFIYCISQSQNLCFNTIAKQIVFISKLETVNLKKLFTKHFSKNIS